MGSRHHSRFAPRPTTMGKREVQFACFQVALGLKHEPLLSRARRNRRSRPPSCGVIRYNRTSMASESKRGWSSHRRAIWEIAIFGLYSGVLITAMMLAENRLLGVAHSSEIYALLVAAVFAGVGIRLGLTFIGRKPTNGQDVAMPAVDPFRPDEERLTELKITPRELEILRLIAEGLSTREIADKLFVSDSTVKTHSSRLFDKLGAKRRTQAVQLAKVARLIP
jgi:two-component system, NarL family, response regulator LiaR